MTDWWEQIEEDERAAEKANRLANCLSRFGGTREQKVEFLVYHLPLMEAEARQEWDPEEQPKQYGAKMVSLAFRFYRMHRKKLGETRPQNREMPQELRGVVGRIGGKR